MILRVSNDFELFLESTSFAKRTRAALVELGQPGQPGQLGQPEQPEQP